jgi:hypothetical protein
LIPANNLTGEEAAMSEHVPTDDEAAAPAAAPAGTDRRTLIRRAAIATGIGWVAPMVVDGFTNPAAAVTAAPGCYWIAYVSTTDDKTGVPVESTTSTCPPVLCTGLANNNPVNATAASVGLQRSTIAIGHDITPFLLFTGNIDPMTLSIQAGYSCRIVGVRAVIHHQNIGLCPSICQTAGQPAVGGDTPAIGLTITAGSLGSTSITVRPNQTNNAVCNNEMLHWGSTSVTNGYLVVTVQCP